MGLGQLGPFIGTALYPESDKPFYVRGMTACALFMVLVGQSLQSSSFNAIADKDDSCIILVVKENLAEKE